MCLKVSVIKIVPPLTPLTARFGVRLFRCPARQGPKSSKLAQKCQGAPLGLVFKSWPIIEKSWGTHPWQLSIIGQHLKGKVSQHLNCCCNDSTCVCWVPMVGLSRQNCMLMVGKTCGALQLSQIGWQTQAPHTWGVLYAPGHLWLPVGHGPSWGTSVGQVAG